MFTSKISHECTRTYLFLKDTTLVILYSMLIGLVGRVFANGPGDLSSIPGHVIPKTLKMVLDTSLLNTQQYKVRIKGKVERPPLLLSVVDIEKGAFWSPSTTVANLLYSMQTLWLMQLVLIIEDHCKILNQLWAFNSTLETELKRDSTR